MADFFFDTSALVKRHVSEIGGAWVKSLVSLRAYDAVQLAAALEVNRLQELAGLGPVMLISSDQALNDAATAEGFTVDDPRQHP